ncbi:MAG TPA: heparan-alpha-glucosaminide N-acetyltransferase domain-containing protein [Polyangiaceae bacterium]
MPSDSEGARPRLEAIDAVRGVIMVLMALDHVRDFFGVPGRNPTDLSTASAPLFLTRWITYFCAPVFFFLMGTGARLSLRKKTPGELARFLVTRGVWLLFLEVVVLRCLAYQFNVDYRVTMLLVLWALGWSMIALAPLVRLDVRVPTALGVVLIAGHNLFDSVRSASPLWSILHAPNFVVNTPEHVVFVAYPLIPWVGVTFVGFGLGQVYGWEPSRRRAFLRRLGLALTAGFLALRVLNAYGDPNPWEGQPTLLFTALSFLNTTKYPPSLAFLLMTLGPAILLLRLVDGWTPALLRPAVVVGRVPLFYYALHFALIHLLAVGVCWLRYGAVHWMFESSDLGHYPFSPPPAWGFPLAGVYAVWGLVVVAMYFPCRWFAALKQRRRDVWLSYL